MIINKINIYDVLCSCFNIMYEGFFLHGRKGLWLVVGTGIFRGEKSVCVQGGGGGPVLGENFHYTLHTWKDKNNILGGKIPNQTPRSHTLKSSFLRRKYAHPMNADHS